ncbi:hypothetical protein DFP74_1527 [Nocardiopsis sp. Huas11]|uniref:hypothetical protein n=1 Tax=Nocardiopsis sp. Huas11 TaxID=2183912 RepID=UPI000EABC89A|nr:hypothetical protein [Nocardiopsis sp. Huas11]RKS05911.1 hypothetical protein DFP74_1527 [Nocardiopsis sp. Huas11]
MDQPNGRHRRPHQSLAAQVWAVAATLLAAALMFVFVPHRPQREQLALPPLPRRRQLAAAPVPAPAPEENRTDEPDESPGPVVRPYMPPPPPPPELRPLIPRPRAPEGDLLATPQAAAPPVPSDPDDLSDLTQAIRTYLAMTR